MKKYLFQALSMSIALALCLCISSTNIADAAGSPPAAATAQGVIV